MKSYNKPLLALIIGAMTILGAAGVASARPGGHGGHGGGSGGWGCPGYGQAPSPEHQQMMESAYNRIAPMMLELRAKQDELTAKIYSGADDRTIQDLTKEVSRLQAQVTEARTAMQQQFAKAGVPMHRGGCAFAGSGGHRGMGHGGPHGWGRGPATPPPAQ